MPGLPFRKALPLDAGFAFPPGTFPLDAGFAFSQGTFPSMLVLPFRKAPSPWMPVLPFRPRNTTRGGTGPTRRVDFRRVP
jgi:hypothetical protein